MSFVSNLASTSGSGVYGGIGPTSNASAADDVLGLVNRIKDRNMEDYKNKLNIQQQLQNQQEGLRQVFAPPGQLPATKGQPMAPMPNVQEKPDPNQMQNENEIPAAQKMELGIRNRQLDLQSQRMGQQDKLAQQGLDIKSKQEALNQQKSDQIRDQKQADLQAKIDAANQKHEDALKALTDKNANLEKTIAAHKAVTDAANEIKKAEDEARQYKFDTQMEAQNKKFDELVQYHRDNQNVTQTTNVNADGTQKTVNTQRGAAPAPPGTMWGVGKDGKQYPVPLDKIDDWNANHAAPGTAIKPQGSDDQNDDGGSEDEGSES